MLIRGHCIAAGLGEDDRAGGVGEMLGNIGAQHIKAIGRDGLVVIIGGDGGAATMLRDFDTGQPKDREAIDAFPIGIVVDKDGKALWFEDIWFAGLEESNEFFADGERYIKADVVQQGLRPRADRHDQAIGSVACCVGVNHDASARWKELACGFVLLKACAVAACLGDEGGDAQAGVEYASVGLIDADGVIGEVKLWKTFDDICLGEILEWDTNGGEACARCSE